ncbi:MAG TPA: type II secretion system protein GspC [Anaeromyxobacter sp.]|nr:type II secretion system protein GspC [Anaeromyxobacter sp.]
MLDLFFQKYAWTANLLILFAAAWFSAKILNTVVGALIRPRPQADLKAVPASVHPAAAFAFDEKKLYHLLGVDPPAVTETKEDLQPSARPRNCADPSSQPVKSDLRFSLVAGVLSDRPRFSLATIADGTTRESRVLGVGEKIGNAQLLGLERIHPDGDITGNAFKLVAVICNGGTKEFVESDPTVPYGEAAPNIGVVAPVPRPGPPSPGMEGVRTVGPNRYEVDRKVIDATLTDLNQIATQARIVPSFKNGVANGFKLFSIQPGSLYSSIGVENGDVIERVNGYDINSPEKALELYQKLRDSSHVAIDLERNGQPLRKEYTITGP